MQKFYKITLFSFLFLLSLNKVLGGATYSISGYVTTADKAEDPIIGATVILMVDQKILEAQTTNKEGFFQMLVPKQEGLILKIAYLGFKAYQEPIEFNNQPLRIRLEESWIDLSPIQIIGGADGNFKRIPGEAFKIESKEIKLMSPIGTQEVLDFIPGITAYSDDGFGNSRLSIGIRGLDPRRSARVLIMEDGIPIQPAPYMYPNVYYNPPIERLDEIEVIKGSAGIQFGPQTMGGIINYVTRRPREEFGGMSQITFGTNGYLSAYAEIGGWGTKNIQPELQILYKRGDGFRENNAFEQFNGTFKTLLKLNEQKDLYIKYNINHEFSEATYTGLTEWSYQYMPEFNPKDNDEFTVFRNALDLIYKNQINKNLIGVTKIYGSIFSRDWWREDDMYIKASSLGAWLEGKEVDEITKPNANLDLVRVGNGKSNYGILREFYVSGVDHTYDFSHRLFNFNAHLNAGAKIHSEYYKEDFKLGDSPTDRQGAWYETADPSLPDGPENRIALKGAKSLRFRTLAGSAYLQETIHFNDKLSLRVGSRFEAFDQSVIDRLNRSTYRSKSTFILLPGIGFNYEMGSYNLFGGIHRGFTPPTSAAINLPFISTSDEEVGIDLEAEKSTNYELGLRGSKGILGFETSAFYMDITDIVTPARSTVFLELGNISTYGLEIASQLKVSEKITWLPDLHLAYSYLESKVNNGLMESHINAYLPDDAETVVVDVSGNKIPYTPKHSLNLGLSKDFAFGFSLRLDFRYIDEVYTDYENLDQAFLNTATITDNGGNTYPYLGNVGNAGIVPAYYIFDLSASYAIRNNWKIKANVKNLLDEVYIGSRLHSHPSRFTANASSGILVGPRRQFNVGVSYNF
ncbi:TonB-dependent receptor family protein [Xanthovirga aplysinae]|uniref:TonB-dependent receptor family protein n=1 Tax=Xanthovirga aplysinae TaxID=2529853 RepID=UPI0012BC720F|nr:TonB-dependent receptor [Xanthovirga aplysinae]MTI32200.1 TonB-dependent receptor [Xanthovirga aplysinae]